MLFPKKFSFTPLPHMYSGRVCRFAPFFNLCFNSQQLFWMKLLGMMNCNRMDKHALASGKDSLRYCKIIQNQQTV